jgi:hypothetical protein
MYWLVQLKTNGNVGSLIIIRAWRFLGELGILTGCPEEVDIQKSSAEGGSQNQAMSKLPMDGIEWKEGEHSWSPENQTSCSQEFLFYYIFCTSEI